MQDEFSKHANSSLPSLASKLPLAPQSLGSQSKCPSKAHTSGSSVLSALPSLGAEGIEPGSLHPARHTLVSCALRVCPCSLHRLNGSSPSHHLPGKLQPVFYFSSNTHFWPPPRLPTMRQAVLSTLCHKEGGLNRLSPLQVLLLALAGWGTPEARIWAAQALGKPQAIRTGSPNSISCILTQATRPLRASSGPQFLHG